MSHDIWSVTIAASISISFEQRSLHFIYERSCGTCSEWVAAILWPSNGNRMCWCSCTIASANDYKLLSYKNFLRGYSCVSHFFNTVLRYPALFKKTLRKYVFKSEVLWSVFVFHPRTIDSIFLWRNMEKWRQTERLDNSTVVIHSRIINSISFLFSLTRISQTLCTMFLLFLCN